MFCVCICACVHAGTLACSMLSACSLWSRNDRQKSRPLKCFLKGQGSHPYQCIVKKNLKWALSLLHLHTQLFLFIIILWLFAVMAKQLNDNFSCNAETSQGTVASLCQPKELCKSFPIGRQEFHVLVGSCLLKCRECELYN